MCCSVLQASSKPPVLLVPHPWQSLQPGAPFHPRDGVGPRDQVLCDLVYLFNNVLRLTPFHLSALTAICTLHLCCTSNSSLNQHQVNQLNRLFGLVLHAVPGKSELKPGVCLCAGAMLQQLGMRFCIRLQWYWMPVARLSPTPVLQQPPAALG